MIFSNKQIADQFEQLAARLEQNGADYNDRFRYGAYYKVAKAIRNTHIDVSKSTVKQLMEIKGVGKNSAEKIYKACQTGVPLITEPDQIKQKYTEKDEIKLLYPVIKVLSINGSKTTHSIVNGKHVFVCYHSAETLENTIGMLQGISWDIENGVTNTSKVHRKCVSVEYWVYFKE